MTHSFILDSCVVVCLGTIKKDEDRHVHWTIYIYVIVASWMGEDKGDHQGYCNQEIDR